MVKVWHLMHRIMKPFPHLLVFGVVLAMVPLSMAQEKSTAIKLRIFYNGQERPVPDQITLKFKKHTLSISLVNGAFEVPSGVLPKSKVAFSAELENSYIATVLPAETLLDVSSLEILIADKSYGDSYGYVVPRRAKISNSCIIVFSPKEVDGYLMFDPHCRSKRK